MISMDKTYRTRDGREVRLYAIDGGGTSPVHGAFKNPTGWISCYWMSEGFQTVIEGPYDLIEAKPRIKREVWLSLYPNGGTWFCLESSQVRDDCLAKIKVEIDVEEGHGL